MHTRLASVAAIREVARQLYESMAGSPPNVTEAEQLIRSKLAGARRKLVRPILAEPEFVNRRRKAGRPAKVQKTDGEPTNAVMPITSTDTEAGAAGETLTASANTSVPTMPVRG